MVNLPRGQEVSGLHGVRSLSQGAILRLVRLDGLAVHVFESHIPPALPSAPLYFVELQNADHLEAETRVELEAAIRVALDQAYGSHTAAAAAVHAHWDSDEESQGLDAGGPGYLSDIVPGIASQFAQQVPVGAQFVCTPDFEALARPMA